MGLETGRTYETYDNNLSEINKILWRDCSKFIDSFPEEKKWKIKKALWIENLNIHNPELVRRRFQRFQSLRRTWKDIDEILLLAEIEKDQYINKHSELLNFQEQQKSNLINRLNKLWISNSSALLEILENDDSKDFWLILLDTLIYIKEGSWDIFNWKLNLSSEWISAIRALYPDIDPKNITLNQLNQNFSDEHKWIARPLIENELNERFLSSLDKSLRSSNSIEDSRKAINSIINSNSLKFFVDYYNYKNPWKALDIDLSQPLTPDNRKKLEKAIQEELYQNWFVTNLTDEEKIQLDNEANNKILFSRRNRERFRNRNRLKEEWLDPESWLNLAISNNIWKKLLEKFNRWTEKFDIKDSQVISYARRKFCKDNKLRWLWHIPPDSLKALYDETNKFSNFDWNWENLQKFRSRFWKDELQFNNACSLLKLRFYSYFDEAQDKISKFHSRMGEKKDIARNNLAIGSVIDGIKSIFTGFWNKNNIRGNFHGLVLDKSKPVELESNNEWLIINWTFNWNPVKIKYDLITWEVFMNSCISKRYPSNTIIFWESYPNLYVWEIEDFVSKLKNYEADESPQDMWKINVDSIESRRNERKQEIQESFNNQVRRTWEEIWTQLESSQAKNELTTDFLRTLWIIDSDPNKSDRIIQIDEWSDIYKVVEIINNSEKESIQALSDNIKILAEFAWRNWWNNIPNKDNIMHKELNEIVRPYFNKMNDNEKIKYQSTVYFLEKTATLNDIDFKLTWELKVPEGYKNSFAAMIYEKFTDWEMPNRKLNHNKIVNFTNELKTDVDLIVELQKSNIW